MAPASATASRMSDLSDMRQSTEQAIDLIGDGEASSAKGENNLFYKTRIFLKVNFSPCNLTFRNVYFVGIHFAFIYFFSDKQLCVK